MTVTYDPRHPSYLDEADVRQEMTRVFDVCRTCRSCIDLCTSFPTLFEMIDRREVADAGLLTPDEQDRVVDECRQCTLCTVNCPYVPGRHDWSLDFSRLMLRATAMRRENGHVSARSRRTSQFLARTDLVGRIATTTPLVNRFINRVITAEPGSIVRRLAAAITGVSATRVLPPFAERRFSAWFTGRPTVTLGKRQGRVTVFPTCLVEYQDTTIGKDLVRVYERNGIECSLSDARCCGAPWLHCGDVGRFSKVAERNVAILAAEVRAGTDVVVAQPTCSHVLKERYVDYVRPSLREDAELVARHTSDAAEYLMRVHAADGTVLDTHFTGAIHRSITYHAPCHLRAQKIGLASRDLMRLTGAHVTVVQRCAGVDGLWGLRAGTEDLARPFAGRLAEEIERGAGDVVAGDCHLANTAISEHSGSRPAHPIQVVARAYGIPADRAGG